MVYSSRKGRRENHLRNVVHHRRRSSLGLFDNRRARTPVSTSQLRLNDVNKERTLSSRRANAALVTPASNRSRARNQSNTTNLIYLGNRSRRIPHEKDLTYMYEKVLRCVQKGQIKPKNCWDIKFVQHIDDIVQMDAKNFTRNGTVINAASVVLTTQIDSVHNQGIRVWRSLGSKKSLNPVEANKRRLGKPMVSRNNLITVAKTSDLLGARDPLFEKTAGMFDEGGVKGLLLANLATQNGEIVFRGDDCLTAFIDGNKSLKCSIVSSNTINEDSDTVEESEKDVIPELIQMFSKLDNVSENETTKQKLCINTNFCSNVINFYNKQKDTFATGLPIETEQDLLIDIVEGQSDVDNSFNDVNFDDYSGGCSVSSNDIIELNVPETIVGTENQEEFEFEMSALTSYFSKDDVQAQSWKGPESWKKRRIHSLRKEVSSNNIPMLKALHEKRMSDDTKTPKKEITAINFLDFLKVPTIIEEDNKICISTSENITPMSETETEICSNFIQNIINDNELNNIPDSERPDESSVLMKRMMLQTDQTLFRQVDRSRILMSKSKYNARKNNHHYLPRDLNVKPDYFFRCSLRPNVILWCKEPADLSDIGEECVFDLDDNEYDSDINPLDTQFDDHYDDDISEHPIEQITAYVNPMSGTTLIIPYTKDPCDINVSMMKKKIWSIICEKEESGVARIKFNDLVILLISRLPSHVTKKITVHIIFVCLLYCCNEYSLRIYGTDLHTFEIKTTINSPLPGLK